MKRYTITLLDGPEGELRVPAEVLAELLAALQEGVRRAARLRIEGLSFGGGPAPAWLDKVSRLDVTGLGSGSAVQLEAPTFAGAAPDHFPADAYQQMPIFVEPTDALDVTLTAVDLFCSVLAAVLSSDAQHVQVDRPMLEACVRFAQAPVGAFGGVRLEDVGQGNSIEVRAADAARLEHLRDQTPRPRAVRVVGVLDTICPQRSGILLKLRDGTPFPGRIATLDAEALPGLLGARVAIEGMAFARPSGRVSIVDVDYLGPAREQGDELFERAPASLGGPLLAPVPQDERSGVAAVFGTWPCDETDEELLAQLEEVRREK